MDYENQMETLQDELEEKLEKDLREVREELDKQGREITASAIEELQRKHFMEIDALRAEHEQIYAQMSTAQGKEENELKEDIQGWSFIFETITVLVMLIFRGHVLNIGATTRSPKPPYSLLGTVKGLFSSVIANT